MLEFPLKLCIILAWIFYFNILQSRNVVEPSIQGRLIGLCRMEIVAAGSNNMKWFTRSSPDKRFGVSRMVQEAASHYRRGAVRGSGWRGRAAGTCWVTSWDWAPGAQWAWKQGFQGGAVATPRASPSHLLLHPGDPGPGSRVCPVCFLSWVSWDLTSTLPCRYGPHHPWFSGSSCGAASLLTFYRNKWEVEGTEEARPEQGQLL